MHGADRLRRGCGVTTIEKMTAVEAADLCQDASGGVGEKALRVIDALTAENERLQANLAAMTEESDGLHIQCDKMHARAETAERKLRAAEASLVTAEGMLAHLRSIASSVNGKYAHPDLLEQAVLGAFDCMRDALASAQPAAPVGYEEYDTDDRREEPAAPTCTDACAHNLVTRCTTCTEYERRLAAPLPQCDVCGASRGLTDGQHSAPGS